MNSRAKKPEVDGGKRLRRRLLAAATSIAIGAAALVGVSAPAYAAPLTGVSLAVSSNVAGATNVTYTWTFTPGSTSATLDGIDLTVPTGTTWTPTAATIYGIAGGTVGTPTFSSDTVTVPYTASAAVTAGRPVSISITGVTNGATVASFQSAVTLDLNGTTDTGTAGALALADNTTDVTVLVPESLTFTNNATDITLLPIPGGSVATASSVELTVSTNATDGYTLQAYLPTPLTDAGDTIPNVSTATGTPLTGGTDYGFGARASLITSTGGSITAPWAAGTYLGYQAAAGSSAQIASSSGPAELDTLILTNGAKVSGIQAAGVYTGTITYVVTPSF